MNKIHWIYEGESGYWHSSEHRFTISPDGFRSGVTPDYYVLTDEFGRASTKQDTIGECKAHALAEINTYEKHNYSENY